MQCFENLYGKIVFATVRFSDTIENFDHFSILAVGDREFGEFLKTKDDEAKEEHKCDGAETIEEITPSHVIGLVTACLAGGHIFARR